MGPSGATIAAAHQVRSVGAAVAWGLAGLVVLLAVGAELWRPLAPSATPVDLVAAGVPADVVAQARTYRDGLEGLRIAGLALRLAVGLIALAPPVTRRVAGRLRVRADRRAARGRRALRPVVAGLAGGTVWVVADLVRLPLQVEAWRRSVEVGLSTQDLGGFLRDTALVTVPYWLGVAVTVALVAWIIDRGGRAWVPVTGLLLGCLGVGMIVVSPLVLEPLTFSFTPLPEGTLRAEVEVLSAEALGRAPDEVLVADASRRTTASNAYVSGIGATRRIVLYDTLLADAPKEQVLAIVAHELAHRANHDLERTAAAVLGTSVVGVAALAWLLRRRLRGPDGRVLPAVAVPAVGLALVAAVLVAPLERWSSRRAEAAADHLALQLTDDPGTFVDMMAGLAQRNLADPDPAGWTVALWYTHPPIAERIGRALDR